MSNLESSNTTRINELMKQKNLTKKELIKILLDIYELEDIFKLVENIKNARSRGMTAKQINELSIFFTYLATIFEDFARKY
jgi:hypothetical protein